MMNEIVAEVDKVKDKYDGVKLKEDRKEKEQVAEYELKRQH